WVVVRGVRRLEMSGSRGETAVCRRIFFFKQKTAYEIYREGGSRYVAIKYSIPARDLGSTVEEAMAKVDRQVKLPEGYHVTWAGEYESQKRSSKRLMVVGPLTLLLICSTLSTIFKSLKY